MYLAPRNIPQERAQRKAPSGIISVSFLVYELYNELIFLELKCKVKVINAIKYKVVSELSLVMQPF